MKLRVITATRGDSPHLEATVATVAAIAGAGHLLVSPAGACAELARRFPGVRVLPEGGAGLYVALNTGWAEPGDEELVTWVNDDDLLDSRGVAEAMNVFAADASVGAVYGRVELIDAAARRLGELPVAHRPGDLLALASAGLMPLAQPGTVFRRRALAAVGGFDPSYRLAGDLDLLVRALQAGVVFRFADTRVAQFRLHPGQLSKDEVAVQREHARAVGQIAQIPSFAARLRFRWANLPVYIERIRRHGFVSMQSLYRHG